jgi:hypothetical protein
MKDTTPRPQRKAFPSKEYIQSIAYLFTDKGKTSIPKKTIIKSHSERHELGDTKGDKLLIIYPEKVNELTLKRNRKKIGSLRYYGSFDGGGFRYYAQSMGYKFEKCEVWIGKKKIADINGGFRDGTFR